MASAGRNASSVALDLKYIADTYGASPALLRMRSSAAATPVRANTLSQHLSTAVPLVVPCTASYGGLHS